VVAVIDDGEGVAVSAVASEELQDFLRSGRMTIAAAGLGAIGVAPVTNGASSLITPSTLPFRFLHSGGTFIASRPHYFILS